MKKDNCGVAEGEGDSHFLRTLCTPPHSATPIIDNVFLTFFYVDNRLRTHLGLIGRFFCCVDNHLLVQDLYSMSPEGYCT